MRTKIAKMGLRVILTAMILLASGSWLGAAEIEFTPLTRAGHKTAISADMFIVYEFSERPKMGTIILKIQVFDKDGNKITPVTIQGRSGMPSMPGHHDSGQVEFKLNRKNDYLLPVDVVMPGDWEVRLTFKQNDKVIFLGRVNFDV